MVCVSRMVYALRLTSWSVQQIMFFGSPLSRDFRDLSSIAQEDQSDREQTRDSDRGR